MRLRIATALPITVAAAWLAGCGMSAPSPSGRALFAASCAGCHSLSGVQSPRRQGGDLLRFHASSRQMLELTREMPVRHPLSAPELRTVARYVIEVERSGRR
jgi:mono/diheme cytochrome c family protein